MEALRKPDQAPQSWHSSKFCYSSEGLKMRALDDGRQIIYKFDPCTRKVEKVLDNIGNLFVESLTHPMVEGFSAMNRSGIPTLPGNMRSFAPTWNALASRWAIST